MIRHFAAGLFLALLAAAVVAHGVLTAHLAEGGLLGGLLSPNPRTALTALLAGSAWYTLRLSLAFGLPALVGAWGGWWLMARAQAAWGPPERAAARTGRTPATAPR